MQCNHPGSEKKKKKRKNGVVKELFHSADTIMDKQNNYYHGMETG